VASGARMIAQHLYIEVTPAIHIIPKIKSAYVVQSQTRTISTMNEKFANSVLNSKRVRFIDYLLRRVTPPALVSHRAATFASDNRWLGDLRVSVYGLPLGHVWVRITDREGNVISTETSRSQMIDLLDACQDQWDIAQQFFARLFALTENQFTTARVLYRDGMPLDTAIEAARRL
jgi:hypothetical protein